MFRRFDLHTKWNFNHFFCLRWSWAFVWALSHWHFFTPHIECLCDSRMWFQLKMVDLNYMACKTILIENEGRKCWTTQLQFSHTTLLLCIATQYHLLIKCVCQRERFHYNNIDNIIGVKREQCLCVCAMCSVYYILRTLQIFCFFTFSISITHTHMMNKVILFHITNRLNVVAPFEWTRKRKKDNIKTILNAWTVFGRLHTIILNLIFLILVFRLSISFCLSSFFCNLVAIAFICEIEMIAFC